MTEQNIVGLSDKNEIRKELLNEIITGYDQLIGMMKTGGQAALSGHAYDQKENDREIALLENLKKGLIEMLNHT